MKRIFLILFVTISVACNKIIPRCYECQIESGSTDYYDVGCYTKDEWDSQIVEDDLGNTIDKGAKCRKK